MTGNTHYSNPASQAEKRRVLKDTLHSRVVAEADTIGGRWAMENQTRVIGSGAQYPPLPPDSPFASNPVPPEEPLGYLIDEMAPVGTAPEIQESLRGMNDGAGMDSIEPSIDSPTSGEQLRRRPLLRRRRAGSPPLKRRGRR